MAIVVSHIADDFDVLAERALRQSPLADLIEIRLDRSGHPGTKRLAAFLGAAKKPVIVACPGSEAHGAFDGDDEARLDLLREAAELGARFVDVDWSLSLDLGEVKPPCHRIVSRHEVEEMPGDLARVHEEVQEVLHEGDVTKIVARARTCEEGLALLAWLRTTRGVVAFASGEPGRFTRVLAPIFGSPFTYCAPAASPGEPAPPATAPGQIPVNELRALLPPGGVSQETAIFGVVGRPVARSLSPWVQGMGLKAARLDAVYVAFEPETLDGFLALAQDENFRGLSITAPFKEAALAHAALRDESSERAGATNTLLREKVGWRAANTDVPAVRETLAQAFAIHARAGREPREIARATTLCLGSGGAARAVLWAVRSLGGRALVAGRRHERAERLARELGCEAVPWSGIPGLAHDVLVNATPVGSAGHDEGPVIPAEWIRPGTLVLDAVYRPIRTKLLAAAHARGCTAVPGGEWFVRQAMHQFRLFTRHDPDEALMRKAFEHAV
jgi:3-dehydroquinate dehydratase/shikimate dehydrogenase